MLLIKRIFPAIFLLLNGLVYCVLTYLFLVDPISWFSNLGIELLDATGYTELKTMYIGLMGSLGVFSIIAALAKELRLAGLLLALLSYGALAAVRSWGIYIEGVYSEFMLTLLRAEIVSFLLALLALYCLQSSRRAPVNPYRL